MRDRRWFLRSILGGTAAATLAPSSAVARRSPADSEPAPPPLPPDSRPPDEAYWRQIQAAFPLAPGRVLMNAANLCPTPYAVREAVFRLTRDVDADASFQNRAKYEDLREAARAALSRYVGADPDEVALTRNTSEGNNTVVAGLDLRSGDEVVLWDQNHPTNSASWDERAKRIGFGVRRVTTPSVRPSKEALIEAFEAALTRRTRVLALATSPTCPARHCRRASSALWLGIGGS